MHFFFLRQILQFYVKKFDSFGEGQLYSFDKSCVYLSKFLVLTSYSVNCGIKAVEKPVENVDNIGGNVGNTHNYMKSKTGKYRENRTFS